MAIQSKPQEFGHFANSKDRKDNLREIAAFFAHVHLTTTSMFEMEEKNVAPSQYCSSDPVSGADTRLKRIGLNFPCYVNQTYGGRGYVLLYV